MLERMRLLVLVCGLFFPFAVRGQGVSTSAIDQALGRSGQKTGDVYKVSFPRTDLHVFIHGLAIKPGLALGSWAAFTGTDDNAMVMGDLVLLESELNPVNSPANSPICVRVGKGADNEATVDSTDQGPGIPREHQARVFDRFYRVDKTRTREWGGAGLGLSIARWAIEAHGGDLTLKSEEGQGATFRISLPLANNPSSNQGKGGLQ
jgi:hypothetical protein